MLAPLSTRHPMVALVAVILEQATRIEKLAAANEMLTAKLARLEHLHSRNSKNSSMPPSSDDAPGRTPPSSTPKPSGQGRKRGKQPGAAGTHLEFRERSDAHENRYPQGACGCGADLADAVDLGIADRYQQHEIPDVSVKVTQYDMHTP